MKRGGSSCGAMSRLLYFVLSKRQYDKFYVICPKYGAFNRCIPAVSNNSTYSSHLSSVCIVRRRMALGCYLFDPSPPPAATFKTSQK